MTQAGPNTTINNSKDTNNSEYEINNLNRLVDEERKKLKYDITTTENILCASFPETTPAERLRFLVARDGNVEAASKKIQSYLRWRKDIGVDEKSFLEKIHKASSDNVNGADLDKAHWDLATELALSFSNENSNEVPNSIETLPRLITLASNDDLATSITKNETKITTLKGKRIFQVFGAQLDLDLASSETYAQALAVYLDIKLDRYSMEKMCVIIDVRAGKGWANPTASSIVPLAKHVSRVLSDHFPERLAVCFVYNLPYLASALWSMIKPFLYPVTVAKFQLFTGSPNADAPPPTSKLEKYFDKSVIHHLEEKRKSLFVYDVVES